MNTSWKSKTYSCVSCYYGNKSVNMNLWFALRLKLLYCQSCFYQGIDLLGIQLIYRFRGPEKKPCVASCKWNLQCCIFAGVQFAQEGLCAAGRQRDLSRSTRIPGVREEQPSLWDQILSRPLGVHQTGGRTGKIGLLRIKKQNKTKISNLFPTPPIRTLIWVYVLSWCSEYKYYINQFKSVFCFFIFSKNSPAPIYRRVFRGKKPDGQNSFEGLGVKSVTIQTCWGFFNH